MEKQVLEKWREIYYYASVILKLDPWSRFGERDLFIMACRGSEEEHFFTFLYESCGVHGIALYRTAHACFAAQERLHSPNRKKEPAFQIQDAIIFWLGDREDVSKENYSLIKELGIQCRGRGAWPFFEQYRCGYMPRAVSEDQLDVLLDDMGNLQMMVRAIVEQNLVVDFAHGQVVARFYSEDQDQYFTFATNLNGPRKPVYPVIELREMRILNDLAAMPSKGKVCLDWSYLPTVMKEGKERIIPRLVLIVDSQSGLILKNVLLAPKKYPVTHVFDILVDLCQERGKPAEIQICDEELKSGLEDFCKKTNIKLTMRKQLNKLTTARNFVLEQIKRQ